MAVASVLVFGQTISNTVLGMIVDQTGGVVPNKQLTSTHTTVVQTLKV